MNLVFGGQDPDNECDNFWENIIFPDVKQYYQITSTSENKLDRKDVRLNALWFALLDQVGLKLEQ